MTDYTDLARRLRSCAAHRCECEEDIKEGCWDGMMQAAADAIEELSKENERFAKMAKVFIDGMNEISDKCADIAGIQAEPPKEETE